MTTKHTPGPWTLGDENNQGAEVEAGPTTIYLDRCFRHASGHAISRDELLANVHLVMAAPDLLEAAERLNAALGDALDSADDRVAEERDALIAAIKKARGGA